MPRRRRDDPDAHEHEERERAIDLGALEHLFDGPADPSVDADATGGAPPGSAEDERGA